MDTQHTLILKRVGSVLLVVGLIDIAIMIYCIANRISYSSSFNIFAVIAGIFLLRGSLRAASVVRWLAVFMLTGFITLLIAWPFMQPVSLTLTQLRLYPGASLATVAFMAFVLGLLYWIVMELGREPIQTALASAGRKQRDMRIPAAIGVGLVIIMGIFMVVFLGGESANHAMSIAEQQAGPGYHLHVSSLNIAKNNNGTFVSGVVTAWNDNEIKNIPVHWEEH
jgi:hypothetical protein